MALQHVVLLVAVAPGVDFERDVAPIFERRCMACHSERARKGGLSLASREELLAGGKSREPGFVAGAPDDSRLIEFVTASAGRKPRMPKGSAPLADAEVATLREWIGAGAPWPEGRRLADRSAEGEFERRLDWWSLKPLADPAVPSDDGDGIGDHPARIGDHPDAAAGVEPARNELDAFVRAKLREQGLAPSPPADPRTLIRRITYDLTGLPPTPEEVAAFVAESTTDSTSMPGMPGMPGTPGTPDAPDAYDRLVDRLLASPRFGERFARPWLDLIHFGETHGYDKDKPRRNAWPYRDWVVASFNADLPFARFVQAQVAGDVLFPGDPDALVATGFVAAGPWDYVGHVELREGTVDKEITRNLDRDDMVMNTLSTFASTTVHCARCHDHKFDAIRQEDYYALQAVFAGVERSEREFDDDPALAARRVELAAQRAAAAASAEPERERLGWHGAIATAAESTRWVQVDLGREVAFDRLVLVPAHESYGGWPGPGFGFPVRFRVEVADEPSFAAPRRILDHTAADVANPGDQPLVIDAANARYVRITATKLWQRTGDYAFALGELIAIAGGEDVARGAAVTASDSIEAPPRWALANLTDGATWLGPVDDPVAWLAHADTLARLDAELAALPPPRRVYTIASRFPAEGSFTPPALPRPIRLLARGDVKSPLAEVAPAALRCVTTLPARFELPADADEGARRAALARWLTDPRNPLPWRSIVNRVWQWHFGRGLVDTPSDFGHMGATPSHPELLDWLARWFQDHGGSLKALHRLIVTSTTYRQSSLATPQRLAADGDNRWLARMPRTRLDAEPTRDALLAIAGRLDLTMGGPSDMQFAFKDDHSPVYDYAGFDVDAASGRRRSIWRFLVRSVPDPFMECLDCPDASLLAPKRSVTITALQSLALLNDPFVIRQCEHFAARLERECAPGDLRAQLTRAFELALARPPTPAELDAFVAHARSHGLAAACRVIVNLDEFLFVD